MIKAVMFLLLLTPMAYAQPQCPDVLGRYRLSPTPAQEAKIRAACVSTPDCGYVDLAACHRVVSKEIYDELLRQFTPDGFPQAPQPH